MVEILKRANKDTDGEIVSFNMSEKEVKEEVDRRTAKAGWTTRQGEPAGHIKIMEQGFGPGKIKPNIWPRDKDGNLIDD